MVTEQRANELLAPFGVRLTTEQVGRLVTYLELLLRWNSKINLTAVRSSQECVTRHFGESLHLATVRTLGGTLLDIGSGAGFPGLALKIVCIDLAVVLLEPVGKKRAFLKEVVRACGMGSVEVRAERLDQFLVQCVRSRRYGAFDAATSRAVGDLENLIPEAAQCLKPTGYLYLWLSHQQGCSLIRLRSQALEWDEPIAIPGPGRLEIWCGRPPG